jgi:ribonuclease I
LQFDLSKILREAGFVPSNKKYTTSKVVAAVRAAIGGHSPVFTCKSGGISEIWICFDKDLKTRNCGASSNSCPKSISIPPFKDL